MTLSTGEVNELIGRQFARLVVLSASTPYARPSGRTERTYLCACACGTERVVCRSALLNGKTKSCGCLKHDSEAFLTHGHYGTRTYRIWGAMIQRCTNDGITRWADYGGRGIRVCDRWRVFASFLEDMGQVPDGYSIERIDNDGNYEPANCKWIPARDQAKNKRPTKIIGERHGLAKLTEADVMEIRRLKTELVKTSVLAKRYSVSQPLIRKIATRKLWRHV